MAFCVEGLIITGEYYLVEIKSLLQMVTRTLDLTVTIYTGRMSISKALSETK